MKPSSKQIILILDNVRSLYNVGSLFRLADGVGAEQLYLCGITGYPLVADDPRPAWVAERADKEIRKTGLAGTENVSFQYFASTAAAIAAARKAGYQIVALELSDRSADYRSVAYRFPVAVVVGHETVGLDSSILESVDQVVHLPMYGKGKSLSVATAAAALLYHLVAGSSSL